MLLILCEQLSRRKSGFDILPPMRVLLIVCFAASMFGQKPNLPSDIDPQSNSRLPLIQRDQLNDADKKVFDDVANTAPGRVSMYSPPIAESIRTLNSGLRAYTQIAAFILHQNGATPGNAELPADAAQLSRLIFGGAAPRGRAPALGPGGGLTPGVKLPLPPAKSNPLDKITPVSDAMLQNPPAGDWLTWRRGFDYQGFSPLKQITKSNVNNLRVAWTWTLFNGLELSSRRQ